MNDLFSSRPPGLRMQWISAAFHSECALVKVCGCRLLSTFCKPAFRGDTGPHKPTVGACPVLGEFRPAGLLSSLKLTKGPACIARKLRTSLHSCSASAHSEARACRRWGSVSSRNAFVYELKSGVFLILPLANPPGIQ